MDVRLFKITERHAAQICSVVTNEDGRCDAPLLKGAEFVSGTYELQFEAGRYFDRKKQGTETPRFLEMVPVRFGISDESAHYHVPLLVSPFAFSTYMGS